ncbi:MAPK-interacting and spindle-stabilizing protein-like, partial [Anomalospiza imberbis]|uniref:MAPK-interacting and spindle-stabilizing protein-like n=1 Tax=Anomalospiza imberbis TaxID=187417 RepID=UPI00358FD847
MAAEPEPEGSDDWLPGERRAVIGRFLESVASSVYAAVREGPPPPSSRPLPPPTGGPRGDPALPCPTSGRCIAPWSPWGAGPDGTPSPWGAWAAAGAGPAAPPGPGCPPQGAPPASARRRCPPHLTPPPSGNGGPPLPHKAFYPPGAPPRAPLDPLQGCVRALQPWDPPGPEATPELEEPPSCHHGRHRGHRHGDVGGHRHGDVVGGHRHGDVIGGHRGDVIGGHRGDVIGGHRGDVIGGHRGDIAARIGRLQQAQLWSFPRAPCPPPGSGPAPPPAGLEPAAPE